MAKNHDKENTVFERFVKKPKDVVNMIAYCLYRLEKLDFYKKSPGLDDKAKDDACETLIAGNHFDRFKESAANALRTATDKAIADAVRKVKPKSFRMSLLEGVIAGIITLLIAPFVWWLLNKGLVAANLWNPFVEIVNSLNKS